MEGGAPGPPGTGRLGGHRGPPIDGGHRGQFFFFEIKQFSIFPGIKTMYYKGEWVEKDRQPLKYREAVREKRDAQLRQQRHKPFKWMCADTPVQIEKTELLKNQPFFQNVGTKSFST